MDTKKIKLIEFVSFNSGVTPDEAAPIYDTIIEAFKNGDKVKLDFAGVDMMTTAFLNVMIGTLYKDYTSDQLKKLLSFDNLSDSIAIRIKKVTENAKLFYSDEKKYNQTVEDVINGTN